LVGFFSLQVFKDGRFCFVASRFGGLQDLNNVGFGGLRDLDGRFSMSVVQISKTVGFVSLRFRYVLVSYKISMTVKFAGL